ncbi:unnamed protein product [Prorocentrum cordatum]|uniref:Secreted protein n=1 Tax=Prorocentrum cordatum TaxID=2364126 RepID=A0ABN9UUR4_9DINO|nr:unnamed protein product [Polarella glacialis]
MMSASASAGAAFLVVVCAATSATAALQAVVGSIAPHRTPSSCIVGFWLCAFQPARILRMGNLPTDGPVDDTSAKQSDADDSIVVAPLPAGLTARAPFWQVRRSAESHL